MGKSGTHGEKTIKTTFFPNLPLPGLLAKG
jgi:hypothetical protein